jgi:dihydrofolate reductase
LALIAAVARNGAIGLLGRMPWHQPEDLAFYKRTTLGHCLIMGRATAESCGALPGRRSILVSRTLREPPAGFELAPDLGSAVALARQTDVEPFINGGAQIYAAALPQVTRMYLTEVPIEPQGDTFFPAIPWDEWEQVAEERGTSGCIYREWRRR